MNKEIIAELNRIIEIKRNGFVNYKIKGFLNDIKVIENVIEFIISKNYDFLSLNEAVACSRALYI